MGAKKRPEAGGSGQRQKAQDVVSHGTNDTTYSERLSSQKGKVVDNYAKIPNGLIDRLMQFRIPGEQMQILMVIIRKTYGWEKQSDWIALNQFVELTGISKRNVLRAIRALEERKIIIVVKNDNKKYPNYRINKKFNQWKSLSKKTPLSKLTITGVKNDNALLSNSPPTIDTLTKDNTTTDSSGCRCENDFSKKETVHEGESEAPTVGSNRYGLSNEQMEFIDLETERAYQAGKIRSTKEAYKHGLIKRAKDGNLDISELDELRAEVKEAAELEEVNRKAEAFGEIQENKVANLPEDQAVDLIRQVLDKTLETWPAEHNGETFHIDSASLNYMLETEWPELYDKIRAKRTQELREAKQQQLMEAMGDKRPFDFCLEVAMEGENGDHQHLKDILEVECSGAWSQATKAARIYDIMRGYIDNGHRQLLTRDRIDRNLKDLMPLSNDLVSDLCRRLDRGNIKYTQPWVY